jgi:hypothetical protein
MGVTIVSLSIMNVIGEARTWTNEEGNLMAQITILGRFWNNSCVDAAFYIRRIVCAPITAAGAGGTAINRESGLANDMGFGMGLFLLSACSLCMAFGVCKCEDLLGGVRSFF